MKKIGLLKAAAVIFFLGAIASYAGTAEIPSASELIDKYTQALDSTSNAIEDYEKSIKGSARGSGGGDQGSYFTRGQYRYDGQGRVYDREYLWGNFARGVELPEDKPRYHCGVVNDEIIYQNSKNIFKSTPGSVVRGSNPKAKTSTVARLFGVSYLAGYIGCDERLDQVLRKASRISVNEKTERIGDSQCYVIEAKTKYGQYKVWLDPEHGFHPTKVLHKGSKGDYAFHHLLPEGGSSKTYLKNVRFEKKDSLWVPMEADAGSDLRFPQGYSKEDYHYKRTKIVIDPNHDELDSFDDPLENPSNDPELKNGTRVRLNRSPKKYIWKDGELVSAVDDAGTAEIPSASELIDKYTQALDSTSSFIEEYEKTTKGRSGASKGSKIKKSFSRGQLRYDNQQICEYEYRWGEFGQLSFTEDKPHYNMAVVNNEMNYQNTKRVGDSPGKVMRRTRPQGQNITLNAYFGVSYLAGYIGGGDERLDAVLNKADQVWVRNKTEKVDGSECFVIEADTKYGRYSIWLDSEHGFHSAQILHNGGEGDYSGRHLMVKGDTAKEYLKNVRFEKIDGIWVPMEADSSQYLYSARGVCSIGDYHYKRTKIVLNPDHDKLGSFDDPLEKPSNDPELTNGTRVFKNNQPIEYIWQDGKLVANVDSAAISQLDKMAEEKKENIFASVSVNGLLDRYAETQEQCKSYIIKSNTKATYSYTGFGNRLGIAYRHSDARFDGDRVKESLTTWGDIGNSNLDLAKEDAIYTSWLWDGEKGYELGLFEKNRLQTAKYPGVLQIHTEGGTYVDYAKETYKRTMISPAQGYVMGSDQDVGAMFLRTDATVKLLDKRSKVNGADCYVIEAEVPQAGKYRVWIDPVHGFNIVRLKSIRETGDLYHGKPLNKDVRWNNFYEVLEFQEVNGVWLPKTFKTKADGHDGGYDFDHQEETQTELYEVNLDPDHEKEGSFLTDDIPNGTQVLLEGLPPSVILIWQDGEIVPDVNELISKRLEIQKQTESIIAKGEIVSKFSYPNNNWSGTCYKPFEIYSDGYRNKTVESVWGNVNPITPNVKKEEADYGSYLWDAKRGYSYVRVNPSKSLGHLIILDKADPGIDVNQMNFVKGSFAGQISGYHLGDDEKIEQLLLNQSQKLAVRKEMDNIRGNKCYVIDATIKNKGTYTIWIDPEHDYHTARLQVQRKTGDYIWSNELREGDYSNEVYDVLEYQKIGEIWYPKKCRLKLDKLGSGMPSNEERTATFTEVIFNPDHEELQSFKPNDIPNGTPTKLRALPPSMNFFWQDGKVVDKSGKVIMDCTAEKKKDIFSGEAIYLVKMTIC